MVSPSHQTFTPLRSDRPPCPGVCRWLASWSPLQASVFSAINGSQAGLSERIGGREDSAAVCWHEDWLQCFIGGRRRKDGQRGEVRAEGRGEARGYHYEMLMP